LIGHQTILAADRSSPITRNSARDAQIGRRAGSARRALDGLEVGVAHLQVEVRGHFRELKCDAAHAVGKLDAKVPLLPAGLVAADDLLVERRARRQSKHVAKVAQLWHDYGMPRVRVSTTVDETLLKDARNLRSELNDAALLDEALTSLLAKHRAAEIDAAYAAYDEHPLDEGDEWGDLASFREAAASS
jgi:hypothetical protein